MVLRSYFSDFLESALTMSSSDKGRDSAAEGQEEDKIRLATFLEK